ncbi:uncharacterized protein LOC142167295 [Nicotiana tabacum]|uniref:Uncharacterized protein LOC142167295 n=1 Tax=Nicotiana tabacum TaxID=4097 RepID=A0AC58SF10_TOBAC
MASGGDFNVIWDKEEKFGGLPILLNKVDNFGHCMNTCNLTDMGFKGSIYTWWNGRAEEDCIFKRLDRVFANMELQQLWLGLEITHLSKIGSDHCPLLLTYNSDSVPIKKSFRFLKFWTEHESYKAVVKENWQADFHADPFILFNHKIKRLKKKIDRLEEVAKVHESQFELNPTLQNRERLQKVQFNDGDRNTKFFHAHVNGKRKRLQLKRIQNSYGDWIEDKEVVADEAVKFFQAQFHEDVVPSEFGIIDHVPYMVDMEQNQELLRWASERFISWVFGIISNNWYSVLINGKPHGFFKSTRGVKQGDPLSPALFILAAEAISRGLNALHLNLYFCGFDLPKWSPKINHLAYADDTIIFSSSCAISLRLIMEVLKDYEAASGQLINKTKSVVYIHHLTNEEVGRKVERVTGITRQNFPFTYLGCPIFYARRNMKFYQGLMNKVLNKMQSWKGKLLSIGGRAVLISHVLQSMPIHLLSAVNAPAFVINKLHKLMAGVFWSNSIEGGSRHWDSWDTLCFPQEEGGIGFRSLHDVSKLLFYKLWWNFRTKPSLWSSFMSQKYYKKMNSIVVPWRKNGSHVWRKMIECRDHIEHQIAWQPKMGSSLFWFENWTRLGGLYFITPPDFFCDESVQNVWKVVRSRAWDDHKLKMLLPEDLANHIIQNIKHHVDNMVLDKPYWMLETRGEFSVKSTWEYVRKRKEPCNAYRMIWEETLPHLFFKSYAARKVWYYFLSCAGKIDFAPSCGEVLDSTTLRDNPGRSSFGYVLGNEEGNVVYACGKEIPEGTNIEVGVRAILEALKYCVEHDYILIDLHTDSMLVKNVIQGEWSTPWSVVVYVEEIRELMGRCHLKISHTLREGNQLADHIANYALDNGPMECISFGESDVKGRRIVNSDKLQCPYLRVKVSRRNTTVTMPYSLNNSHLVVLVLCTYSNEREAGVGTSMALVMLRRQLSDYDIMGELWHENFHVHCSTVLKIVINSAIAYKIQVDKTLMFASLLVRILQTRPTDVIYEFSAAAKNASFIAPKQDSIERIITQLGSCIEKLNRLWTLIVCLYSMYLNATTVS